MDELSDQQLTEQLERQGSQSGPITDTTRAVYRRYLRKFSSGAAAITQSVGAGEGLTLTQDKESSGETVCKPCVSNTGGKDIFISYGRGTVCGVGELKSNLEKAGYSVWLDEQEIVGGSDWHTMIGEAVQSCRALLALITEKYLSSVHCRNELYMANSCRKPLLPVLLEGSTVKDPGVQYAISSVNWIVATDGLSVSVTQQILLSLYTLGIHPLTH